MVVRARSLAAVVLIAAVAGCNRGGSESEAAEGEARPEQPVAEDQVVPAALAAAPMPGKIRPAPWLDGAQRVAALRRGDRLVVAAAGLGWLRLFDPADGAVLAETEGGSGTAHVLEVADVDGDGAGDLILGRGRGRDALEAGASVSIYLGGDLQSDPETIELPDTTRADLVGISAVPGRPGVLWAAAFESKYMVQILEARRDGGRWEAENLATVRMAFSLAAADVDGRGGAEVVVARPYGDSIETDGDVLVLDGGDRHRVPSVRGARGVVAVPGPGPDELVFSDGWHREYGTRAQALITRARRSGNTWRTEVLAHVAGRHGYTRLRLADIDGDGGAEILAAGNGPAVVVALDASPDQPARAVGSGEIIDVWPVDLDGDGADEILLVGATPGIWTGPKSP